MNNKMSIRGYNVLRPTLIFGETGRGDKGNLELKTPAIRVWESIKNQRINTRKLSVYTLGGKRKIVHSELSTNRD